MYTTRRPRHTHTHPDTPTSTAVPSTLSHSLHKRDSHICAYNEHSTPIICAEGYTCIVNKIQACCRVLGNALYGNDTSAIASNCGAFSPASLISLPSSSISDTSTRSGSLSSPGSSTTSGILTLSASSTTSDWLSISGSSTISGLLSSSATTSVPTTTTTLILSTNENSHLSPTNTQTADDITNGATKTTSSNTFGTPTNLIPINSPTANDGTMPTLTNVVFPSTLTLLSIIVAIIGVRNQWIPRAFRRVSRRWSQNSAIRPGNGRWCLPSYSGGNGILTETTRNNATRGMGGYGGDRGGRRRDIAATDSTISLDVTTNVETPPPTYAYIFLDRETVRPS